MAAPFIADLSNPNTSMDILLETRAIIERNLEATTDPAIAARCRTIIAGLDAQAREIESDMFGAGLVTVGRGIDPTVLATIHADEARLFADACAEQVDEKPEDGPTEDELDEWADRDEPDVDGDWSIQRANFGPR
jgi:hypothetical protein